MSSSWSSCSRSSNFCFSMPLTKFCKQIMILVAFLVRSTYLSCSRRCVSMTASFSTARLVSIKDIWKSRSNSIFSCSLRERSELTSSRIFFSISARADSCFWIRRDVSSCLAFSNASLSWIAFKLCDSVTSARSSLRLVIAFYFF